MKKNNAYLIYTFCILQMYGCLGAVDSVVRKDLGHGYIYHEPSGLPFIEKEYSDKGIPGWIVEYAYNAEFIIAIEKDIQLSEGERERLIMSGDFHEYLSQNGYSKYWIIAHANDSIFGPFKKEEYLKKRKELGVPQELKLKSE